MKRKFTLLVSLLVLVFIAELAAQNNVTIDGVFRPRFENRHGYSNIFPEHGQAANFISQRSRLNLKFDNKNFKVGFSIQNVGVWGETGTLSQYDINGTAVHEAWGEILFCEKFSLKAGRQEIIYDDHRIFGSVDWAQQGRSHDAAIFKIKPNENHKVDVGFAYNAKRETFEKEEYYTNNYKAFQYIHWHGNFNDLGISVLALNNGMSYINPHDTLDNGDAKEKIAYSQTIGPRVSYKKDKFKANAAFYLQTGKRTIIGEVDTTFNLSAYYFAFDASFAVTEEFSVGVGVEYLSGNDEKDIYDDLSNNKLPEADKAFTPFYGTNHKFNGWMDYFYVKNHGSSVGLMDIYIPLKYKRNKFSAMLIPHFFSTAGTIYRFGKDDEFNDTNELKEYSKGLGTEIDMSIGYAFSKSAVIKAGYSVMFASETMEVLKDRQAKTGNTWGWVMLVFKPPFLQTSN